MMRTLDPSASLRTRVSALGEDHAVFARILLISGSTIRTERERGKQRNGFAIITQVHTV